MLKASSTNWGETKENSSFSFFYVPRLKKDPNLLTPLFQQQTDLLFHGPAHLSGRFLLDRKEQNFRTKKGSSSHLKRKKKK